MNEEKNWYDFYNIISNNVNDNNIYTGKTTDMVHRYQKHIIAGTNPNCKEYNSKVYKYIRSTGGWDNWTIYEIDSKFCTKKQSRALEDKYIVEYSTLNSKRERPFDIKVYYENNKGYAKEYQKEYRKKNKEKIKKYKKEYGKNNKEKLNKYQREYRKKNKK